jgi:hypothetical protein
MVEYLASTARTLCGHVVGSWFGFSANAAETGALASIAPEQDGFVCELAHRKGSDTPTALLWQRPDSGNVQAAETMPCSYYTALAHEFTPPRR